MYVEQWNVWGLGSYRPAEAVRLADGSLRFVDKARPLASLPWRGAHGGMVDIDIGGGETERLEIDPEKGPMVLNEDGTFSCLLNADGTFSGLPTPAKALHSSSLRTDHQKKVTIVDERRMLHSNSENEASFAPAMTTSSSIDRSDSEFGLSDEQLQNFNWVADKLRRLTITTSVSEFPDDADFGISDQQLQELEQLAQRMKTMTDDDMSRTDSDFGLSEQKITELNRVAQRIRTMTTTSRLSPRSQLSARKKDGWSQMSPADQKLMAYQVAKRNHKLRPQIERKLAAAREKAKVDEQILAFKAMSEQERMECRCRREQERSPVRWNFITMEHVEKGSEKRSAGVFFGLEFPWNEATLVEFGPKWLTKAFQAAGTMNLDNEVTQIKIDTMKIDAGNNAGKFLFEVAYAKDDPELHPKLFAKIPFPMTKESSSDRISSSFLKQPMDFMEINTYRLLEASFPMKIPKFYYGDISNTTTNFILITERVPFAEIDGFHDAAPKPFDIEGPYEKCKDYQLRGSPKEYYTLLVRVHARIAGLWKTGKLCSQGVLQRSLMNQYEKLEHGNPKSWGMDPMKSTGEDASQATNKIRAAVKFISETAKMIFPPYVVEEAFQKKFTNTLMTFIAYHKELDYFRCHHPLYLALGHANLNVDNAYYWRDKSGNLDCGVFDFGGFGMRSVGQTIWWTFNCADFDQFKENLSDYMQAFIDTYRDYVGESIDKRLLEQMICFSALDNVLYMVAAVPNCLKMCPAAEWASIADRHDPRIAGNITGKSTLRTTLQVMGNGIRLIEEMQVDLMLQRWIEDVFVGEWGRVAKSDAVIFGQ